MALRKMMAAALAAAGMLILILDGKTALTGAAAGIELCLKSVIPSLFPFLFLCSILTGALWGGNFPWLRCLGKVLGIPKGAESLLISAALGGYPAGAQSIGENYRENRLSRQDAEHLLTFCSNAGPSFLFGMVAAHFPDMQMVWALWIIQLLSAVLIGCLGSKHASTNTVLTEKTVSISNMLTHTVKAMGMICGWVVLFRILSEFLKRWILWLFPEEVQIFIIGILELSNGCCLLSEIQNLPLRFMMCCVFLSFGGLCIFMQTASVIGNLPLTPYLFGKITQTVIGLALSLVYLHFGWMMLILISTGMILFLCSFEKRSRFLQPSSV